MTEQTSPLAGAIDRALRRKCLPTPMYDVARDMAVCAILAAIEAEFGPFRVHWECPHVDDRGTVPHSGDLRHLVSEGRAER